MSLKCDAILLAFSLGMILSTRALESQSQSKLHSAVKMTMKAKATLRYQMEVARMRREHEESMANLTKHTTLENACNILKQDAHAKPALVSLVEQSLKTHTASLAGTFFRGTSKHGYSPTGGVAKARDMLNSMLSNASLNLERTHYECSVFFKQQCSMMESTREDISGSNGEAADYRGCVLLCQKEINVCEINIPRIKFELETAMAECWKRKSFLERDLKVVMEDITVMESVLALTDCGNSGSGFLQTDIQLLKCKEECGSFIAVNHTSLQSKLAQLQSPSMRQSIQSSLQEAFVQDNIAKPTEFKNDPLPQQAIPSDPCNGISYDVGKGGGGGGIEDCMLPPGTPQCLNLQNKFLIIMSDTVDKRDELLDDLEKLRVGCLKTKHTLEAEIEAYTIKEGDENSKLAECTGGENTAAEEARMKAEQHDEMKTAMMQTRTSCSSKLRGFESEICALKKIRGELFKIKGDTHPFFMDCEVGDWEAEECSVTCGGSRGRGYQVLRRQVITAPTGGGMACPPLTMTQSCNEQPCPVDCSLGEWSGWSDCSARCGGGVQENTRSITVHPRYDGEPCGETTVTQACNMQACDRDCRLGRWTRWSKCSKACGTGSMKRFRFVRFPAVGMGKCPSRRSGKRLQFRKCSNGPCEQEMAKPLVCKSQVDVSVVLDASGTVGPDGWKTTKEFAKLFSTSFEGAGTDAQLSFIAFSGPKSLKQLDACTGKGGQSVDLATDCKIKMVSPFGEKTSTGRSKLESVAFMAGTRLLSGAMEMARSEFTLARRGSTKIALIVTGSRPTKKWATYMAARQLNRAVDKVMFVAVKSNSQALREFQIWSTRPSIENVVPLRDFKYLNTVYMVDKLVTSICDKVSKA
jgi:hypothetical protein